MAGRIQTVDGFGPPMALDAAAQGGGMAFLVSELEKRDMRLLEPLTSVTWPRDIVTTVGGGWMQYTSNIFVDYAGAGQSDSGIIGGQTNDIPIIQADISKDVWKVTPWANILKVPFLDQARLEAVGRSLNDILDGGIRLNYNKSIDNLVYLGWSSIGITGLVNAANVTASMAPNGATGHSTWASKTPQEIMDDINSVIVATWSASQYDLTGMANHLLVPPSDFSLINNTVVSTAGNISLLKYLLENNIATSQGRDLVIVPSRWCIGAGEGSTDRMVAYVNEKDRVTFDILVPISRVMTQPDVENLAYLTGYMANLGQVKWLFPTSAAYLDGI